jgi:hypothetical protein
MGVSGKTWHLGNPAWKESKEMVVPWKKHVEYRKPWLETGSSDMGVASKKHVEFKKSPG